MEIAESRFVLSNRAFRLFLLGFYTLFLELALIRYLAGNIYDLGYFPNLVLLGVFMGMGIGFVFHHHLSEFHSRGFFEAAFYLLFLLILFVFVDPPVVPGFTKWSGNIGGEVFFTATAREASGRDLRMIIFLFIGIVALFSLISQRTAKYFETFAPLTAYSLDIAGSCCGILFFMAISWLRLPAYMWFVTLIPVGLFLQEKDPPVLRSLLCLPLPLIVVFAWQQDSQSWNPATKVSGSIVRWSPYQKVELVKNRELPEIYVNGIGHQEIFSSEQLPKSFYYYPYTFRSQLHLGLIKSVLIIGSGSGNDVAAALLNGVTRVDAVEIDPVIAAFGKEYHPARPYQDPRVNLVIDDGRAFLAATRNKYDLIIFALTDSLVKVSPMAQLRLENYLFTKESVSKAVKSLNQDGFLIFYNFYRFQFIADKIQMMVREATGHYPARVYRKGDFSMMAVGRTYGATVPPILGSKLQAPTDDWPFLYLKERKIPGIYWKAMCGLATIIFLLAFLLEYSSRSMAVPAGSVYVKLAFIFMGISFLLLETKSVIQFSLLFGTTWLNTSLVFLAVLVWVLVANLTARLIRRPHTIWIAYVFLILFCIYSLFFPLANLLSISNRFFRFVLASILTFSPIFFANLIFGLTFRERGNAEQLFGWNLIGAALGGIVEYSSLAFGYNALALLVAFCYTCAFFSLQREKALIAAAENGFHPS